MSTENEKLQKFICAVNNEIDEKVSAILDDAESTKKSILSAAEEESEEAADKYMNSSRKKSGNKEVTGDFVVTFPSGTFPSGYFVFFSGKNGNWKGSVYNQSDTGFNVYVADDASLNNGDVNFIVFDPNWYYKL